MLKILKKEKKERKRNKTDDSMKVQNANLFW